MSEGNKAAGVAEWASSSGDSWARRWNDTDRGLEGLAPHLLAAIVARAPAGPFHGFDVGCGPGSTTIAVAEARPEAVITACDISPALAEIARKRTDGLGRVRVIVEDAEIAAESCGPFDLIFSRHGVMFFADPVRAFGTFRRAAGSGSSIVFSCFQDWQSNPWASELAGAAAGKPLPPPGREPSGFAFADPDYVRAILDSAGWKEADCQALSFDYDAASGTGAVDQALSFFSEIGPASRVLQAISGLEREKALERMRGVIERRFDGAAVSFPAAAWIWSAKAC